MPDWCVKYVELMCEVCEASMVCVGGTCVRLTNDLLMLHYSHNTSH